MPQLREIEGATAECAEHAARLTYRRHPGPRHGGVSFSPYSLRLCVNLLFPLPFRRVRGYPPKTEAIQNSQKFDPPPVTEGLRLQDVFH